VRTDLFDYNVLYAKAVYGKDEIDAVINSLENNPLCDGSATDSFEKAIATLFGKKYGVFVNSASNGLEIVMRSLNLPEFAEVITPACTFGTSYRSIGAAGYRPRLVDVEIGTYIPTVKAIEAAITPNTKAILIPHLIGSIPDLVELQSLCRKHNLIFIEDSADQIGGKFNGLPTGCYSHVTVGSFYASHHITAGGIGGMVCVDDKDWAYNLRSYRDWGRKSVSDKDEDRYTILHGVKYDKKFIHYVNTGNYKCNEMCAAFGLAQLKKIDEFTSRRRSVFAKLYDFFAQYDDLFYLPRITPGADFTWMSFPLTIKSRLDRHEFVIWLENHKIQTRPLFCGNILYHPIAEGHDENPLDFPNSCYIFANSLLLGCHHGMTDEEIDYLCKTINEFIKKSMIR
jgi:CDP-6-deoxy-D-xylo-4-hexulose-3-dehydrase